MDALRARSIFTGDAMITDAAVLVHRGVVVDVLPVTDLPAGCRRHDYGDALIAPGFIDCQVNGGGGYLFNTTPTVATIRRIGDAHRRLGTTAFLPTLISDDRQTRRTAVAAVAAAIADGVPGVLGMHLEGPHLNPERCGIHEPRHLGPPEADDLAILTALRVGRTLVTLAPEVTGTDVVRTLAKAGVIMAIGHTTAAYDTVMAGFAAGVRGVTHLFNAMSPMATRAPGAVGAALDHPAAWCSVIADGHHVHDACLRLAWRSKPPGKLFLVSDAMPPVDTDMSSFRLGDRTIQVRNGRCVAADGTLAGACLSMAAAVRHCVQQVGIPLPEALRMASTYPAQFLHLEQERGRLAPGLAADLVVLDDAFNVQETWVGGLASASADIDAFIEIGLGD